MQFVFCKTHSEGVYDCTIPSSFAKATEDKPSEHRSKAQNAPREPQNKKNLPSQSYDYTATSRLR